MFELDSIDFLVQFCINEIALEGLEGILDDTVCVVVLYFLAIIINNQTLLSHSVRPSVQDAICQISSRFYANPCPRSSRR